MRKPEFCLGENKGADQLRSNSAFVFATRIVHLLYFVNPKVPVSSLLLCLYSSVSDLVGNPEDRFSRVTVQLSDTRGWYATVTKHNIDKRQYILSLILVSGLSILYFA